MKHLWTLLMMLVVVTGCAKANDVFQDIGTNIASPSAFEIDVATNRLYMVNSNSKVLYDSKQGSFQAYDITDPLTPVLIDTTQTQSFSGEIYFDAATNRIYTPNRYSTDSSQTTGLLYNFNVDETSAEFLDFTETTIDSDAFAIECCYPANRVWITTGRQELQYVDLGGDLTPGAIPLQTTLDNGGTIEHAECDFIAIINNQAFLSREWGGIMVVNLDKAGVAGAVPMDYFIGDIEVVMGLATDGVLLYVVGEGNVDDTWTNFLLVIDPSSLTPLTDNTTTKVIDKDDSGILLATIAVGNNPEEVLLSTSYAFVTNQNDDTVSVIDLATRTKIKDITVGDEPFAMGLYTTLAGVDQYVYVGNLVDDTLSIIDIPTLAVVKTFP